MTGTSRLLVLGWHNVHGTYAFPSAPGRGRAGLERQLSFLSRAANVVALDSALESVDAGRPLPRRAVALTFDDGYKDNLTDAVPILRALGLPATFFLVPGFLDGNASVWWEVLSWAVTCASVDALDWDGTRHQLRSPTERRHAVDLLSAAVKRLDHSSRDAAVVELVERARPCGRRPGPELFLDWDDARRLAEQRLTIGSHTCRHAILSRESPQRQVDDLRDSRERLERNLDVPVRLLAYPNGTSADYDGTTTAAAAGTGYSHALTTRDGRVGPATPRYELPRVVVYPERGLAELAHCALTAALRRPLPIDAAAA